MEMSMEVSTEASTKSPREKPRETPTETPRETPWEVPSEAPPKEPTTAPNVDIGRTDRTTFRQYPDMGDLFRHIVKSPQMWLTWRKTPVGSQ